MLVDKGAGLQVAWNVVHRNHFFIILLLASKRLSI
jgi:hypothetical protein